jgi:hypothetical protein
MSFQPVEIGLFLGTWYVVPQPYTAGGSRSFSIVFLS